MRNYVHIKDPLDKMYFSFYICSIKDTKTLLETNV